MTVPSAPARRVVVLGVGNLLMTDEGIGVRCVEQLERNGTLGPEVVVIDGGTSTNELMDDLQNLDLLVIVDAAATGQAPGTIVRMEGSTIPSAFSNKLSPHQHGINDLLAALTLLDRAPARLVLFGVEPHTLALGMELSAVVGATIPELCARITQEVVAGCA